MKQFKSTAIVVLVAGELKNLVTGADVARRLKISRERVRQLAEKEDFPRPIGKLGSYIIWDWPDVERWAKKTGRLT